MLLQIFEIQAAEKIVDFSESLGCVELFFFFLSQYNKNISKWNEHQQVKIIQELCMTLT